MPTGFDAGTLMDGIGSFASALSTIKDTEIKTYDFNRTQEINKKLDEKTGLTGGANVQKTLADLKAAESVANTQAAESAIMEMKAAFDQMQALDVNGVPMTDETGRAMTNLEARERNKLYKEFKEVDQLEQTILNAAKSGEILDWEKLLKKFDYEKMQPELLRQVKATVDQLNSQIHVNASQVAANYASANASNAAASSYMTQSAVNVNYAKLLGQKHLTEQQETNLKRLEYEFGNVDKFVNVLDKLTPKTTTAIASQGINFFQTLFRGKASRSDVNLRDYLSGLSEQELVKLIDNKMRELNKRNKAMSRQK